MSSQIVTVKALYPVYRDREEALSIERVELEENGFEMISGKGNFKPGDKALFVNPDWCLPDEESKYGQSLFLDYIAPNGKKESSKLGKNRRIRAIKFNFNKTQDSTDVIYSNGILLPLSFVINSTGKSQEELEQEDISALLGITKYEEPEGNSAKTGQSKGSLPSGMYSTDETNILSKRVEFPITLNASVKVDGSSITIFCKDDDNGICSRNLNKRLEIDRHVNELGQELIKISYDGAVKYKNKVTNEIIDELNENHEVIKVQSDDVFVEIGLPYLHKILEFKAATGRNIALRGELCGQSLKGSGNKHNPHAKLKRGILFFGIDEWDNGVTKKLPFNEFLELSEQLGLDTVPVEFREEFSSMDELKAKCETVFSEYKERGMIIEGLVLRNDDCSFSAKYMNSEYDSKK